MQENKTSFKSKQYLQGGIIMFDLKCKRQGCIYNEDCNCTAPNVEVGKGTECLTYQDCGHSKEEKDKIAQTPSRKNTQVNCKAKCLFNDNCYCKANGISVMTNDKQPECCTFMPK